MTRSNTHRCVNATSPTFSQKRQLVRNSIAMVVDRYQGLSYTLDHNEITHLFVDFGCKTHSENKIKLERGTLLFNNRNWFENTHGPFLSTHLFKLFHMKHCSLASAYTCFKHYHLKHPNRVQFGKRDDHSNASYCMHSYICTHSKLESPLQHPPLQARAHPSTKCGPYTYDQVVICRIGNGTIPNPRSQLCSMSSLRLVCNPTLYATRQHALKQIHQSSVQQKPLGL